MREETDHVISRGYAAHTTAECSEITSCCATAREKALGLPVFWSGRRDLNLRCSPWQGEHQPRDFNGLAGLDGAKGPERTWKALQDYLITTSCWTSASPRELNRAATFTI